MNKNTLTLTLLSLTLSLSNIASAHVHPQRSVTDPDDCGPHMYCMTLNEDSSFDEVKVKFKEDVVFKDGRTSSSEWSDSLYGDGSDTFSQDPSNLKAVNMTITFLEAPFGQCVMRSSNIQPKNENWRLTKAGTGYTCSHQ